MQKRACEAKRSLSGPAHGRRGFAQVTMTMETGDLPVSAMHACEDMRSVS